MPFRRLPDTDAGRLAALTNARDKAGDPPRADLAFSAATYARLQAELPVFRDAVNARGGALSAQGQETDTAGPAMNIARQCVSHFIQTFNNTVKRHTVFTESDRAFYGLAMGDETVPTLAAEADILRWGDAIVAGEAARLAAKPGAAAMGFPSAAEVGAAIAEFRAARRRQSDRAGVFDTSQEAVAARRPEVDALILDVWDEVEFTFRRAGSPASVRRKAREYGVVYDTRPGEAPDPTPAPAGGVPATPPAPPTPAT